MPYTKEHKAKTKERILSSAQSLFCERGFDSVSVNDVMENCCLTRGGFYAHFNSKSELYAEALKFSARHSNLAKEKPTHFSNKQWLGKLLDGYLSIGHVNGEQPCPLAFLSKDIVARDQIAKVAYSKAYQDMNTIIIKYLEPKASFDKQKILALTAMIIGAVAISRTLEEHSLMTSILSSSREQARKILDGI